MGAFPSLGPPILAALLLAACGAREARPVAEISPVDNQLTCEHLQGEIQVNQLRMTELTGEADRRGRDSVGMVLAAGLVGLAFADSGQTQRLEITALTQRNMRLSTLAAARDCPA
jgi:hypothetical protein